MFVRINHLPRQEGMNEGETERRRMKEGRKEGYGLPLRFHSQNILKNIPRGDIRQDGVRSGTNTLDETE